MKTLMLVVFMSLLSVFLLAGTAFAVCGDGFLDPGEECDDGNTNDYDVCRNDCTIYDPYFIDVPGSFWAFEYIQWLYEAEITTGCDATHYCPTNNVTRAQMAAFVMRTVDYMIDSEIMPTVLSNDGSGSTLDADLLDGQHASSFAASSHPHSGADITTGTVADTRIASTIARDS
jgi:cysteine-rich repeat protein